MTSIISIRSTEVGHAAAEDSKENSISLVPPSFLGAKSVEESAFPEDEAGISAYIDTEQAIDIDEVKTIFTEVEEVGENYIFGITPISNFGGDIDVHVYADTEGWIVAYLKNNESAAKIMQWGTADVDEPVVTEISLTTLVDALYAAGDAASVGIVSSKIKYYDFEYPDADGMTIFIKTRADEGANTVQFQIPANYTLYEASYYRYVYSYYYYYYGYAGWWDSKLKVDGTTISDAPSLSGGTQWWRELKSYGSRIVTGTLHTIEISYEKAGTTGYSIDEGSAGVATVLIYKTA